MSVARHYVMIAAEGKAEALKQALAALAAKVRPLEGSEGVEVFQDAEIPSYFVFVEHWTSIEAHKRGGQLLGRAVLTDVLATIAEPPQGRYLNQIPVV
jgi:heme oxygenase (mycobilin-producing)